MGLRSFFRNTVHLGVKQNTNFRASCFDAPYPCNEFYLPICWLLVCVCVLDLPIIPIVVSDEPDQHNSTFCLSTAWIRVGRCQVHKRLLDASHQVAYAHIALIRC